MGSFSHDSRFLATGIAVWNLGHGQLVWEQPPIVSRYLSPISGLAFSPDDRFLVMSTQEGELRISDAGNGRVVNSFYPHGHVVGMALSPDGRAMVTIGDGDPIKLWRAALRSAS